MKQSIIPCLDIKQGRVVKGKKFKNVQDVADPVTLAKQYEKDQADMLFLLDITGNDRAAFLQIIQQIQEKTKLPLYIGGGIRSLQAIRETLEAGADKVSITSAAITQPGFLQEAVETFGGDRIILSIDAKEVAEDTWHAFISGGKQDANIDAIEWAKQGETIGVSGLLLNSIDTDGVKSGYNIPLHQAVRKKVNLPIIASGGAGTINDFQKVLTDGEADAALAASVFHYGDILISDIKQALTRESKDI